MRIKTLLVALLLGGVTLSAQEYSHSIGAVAGSLSGISYRYWATEQFALQVDLGFQVIATKTNHVTLKGPYLTENYAYVSDVTYMGGLISPSFMWVGELTDNFYINLGGGFSFDAIRSRDQQWLRQQFGITGEMRNQAAVKMSLNAFIGLGYCFDAPVNLSLEFRPGYGQEYDNLWAGYRYYLGFFDWNISLGVRYRFGG